ncbi:MAG: FIST N-terminal domain-containing protein, partial [Pseudomonadota bacterium]
MDNFRAAASLDADGARAARACLDSLGIAADSDSTRMRFGIVYATERLADELPSILSILRDGSPDTQWYGTVGSGIIALTSAATAAETATEGVEAIEVHDQPGLAVLVGEANPDDICGFSTNKDDLGDFSAVHGAWLNTHYPGIVLVHGDPLSQGTEELVSELAERTGAFLIGGLSAMPGLGRDADTEDEEHEITGVQIAKTL